MRNVSDDQGQLQAYNSRVVQINLVLQIFLFLSHYIWNDSFEKYHGAPTSGRILRKLC